MIPTDIQNPEYRKIMGNILKALGDDTRMRIMNRLGTEECNVNTLVNDLDIAQASVSKHLAVLRKLKLVKPRRSGNQTFYRISEPAVFSIYQAVGEGSRRVHQELKSDPPSA